MRVYVLMTLPIGSANQALMSKLKANEHLYTRFRASQAFEELDADIKGVRGCARKPLAGGKSTQPRGPPVCENDPMRPWAIFLLCARLVSCPVVVWSLRFPLSQGVIYPPRAAFRTAG